MTNKTSIGIIGKGFVGSAVANGFGQSTGYDADILIHDKNPERSTHNLRDIVINCEYAFISVPTPSNADGSINLDVLHNCINEINEEAVKSSNFDCIYLLRSTITPGTSREIQKKFPKLNIVFNPEFLTERSANFDFISQTRFILGGNDKLTKKVEDLYKSRFGNSISVIRTNFETAELIKYVCNCYFATKVSFLNEMKLLSDEIDADWPTVIEGFVRDGRIGHSHTQVPGPDGKKGFGGSCFPKDIQALINFGDKIGVNLSVLKGAWNTNLKVRPEKDWEELKGRAIVGNETN